MNSSSKIIIVDDETYICQSLTDYFEDREWIVFSAQSGESALELLKEQACDAAIVDIRMGGMDGETFITMASARYPDMIFVICTGSPEFEISKELLNLSCVGDRVFEKPVIGFHELEDAVNQLMAKRS